MSAFPAQVSKQVSKMGSDAANPHVESAQVRIGPHKSPSAYARVRAGRSRFAHRVPMTTHEHEILTKQQLAELLQVPVRTVEGWRSRGVPGTDPRRNALRGVEIGGAIRYSRKAVLDYIHAAATSDPQDRE